MPTDKTVSLIEHHILRIPTEDEQPHHVLITVKRETSSYSGVNFLHEIGNISVQAHYLAGPISRHGLIKGHLSSMGGSFDTYSKSVKLTNGNVMIRSGFQGLGIGSFMFDVIVKWALERDSSYKISQIKVSEVDATEDNQARRNKFYANFGITFGTPMNEGVIGGCSDPMIVGSLKSHSGWVARLEQLDHLSGLWKIGDELQELLLDARNFNNRLDALKEQISHLRRFKSRVTTFTLFAVAAFGVALWIST